LFRFNSEPLVPVRAGGGRWVCRGSRACGRFYQGDVVAASYEFGNTFLIVSGLLNALVVLDAQTSRRAGSAMTSHLAMMLFRPAGRGLRTLLRNQARDQLRLGLRIFAGLVLGAYALGWIMYWGFR
jgi:hypothetical protein